MEKNSIELKLRKIIREELDYYFDRLESRLNESKSINTPTAKSSETFSKPKESNVELEKRNFRKKFSGIMEMITEGMEYPEEEDTQKSILDSRVLSRLETNPKTEGVYKALTKDYSALIKKMDKK